MSYSRRFTPRYRWGKYWRKRGHVAAPLVEDCPAVLDVLRLAATGFRAGYHVMPHPITDVALGLLRIRREGDMLRVWHGEEGFTVPLLRTYPTFGGCRWWAACPRCGRRVAKLYKPFADAPFACRTCHALTYEKCRRHKCGGPRAVSPAAILASWQRVNRELVDLGCPPAEIPYHIRKAAGVTRKSYACPLDTG